VGEAAVTVIDKVVAKKRENCMVSELLGVKRVECRERMLSTDEIEVDNN